jgi:hypothetical protein
MEERKVLEFIARLKNTTEFDPKMRVHWLGSFILTNDDMKKMCSNFFGRDYDLLTYAEQRRLRERIFKALRDNG